MKKFKEIVTDLDREYKHMKYPNFPKAYIPEIQFLGTSTNVLEKKIVAFIQLHGWTCERVKNTGTARVETLKRANGYNQSKVSYTKGTGLNGTADVRAVINGISVSIEVKNSKTKDRMSEAQKSYKDQVELSGGIYYVASEIESFVEWFNSNFNKHPQWDKAVLKSYAK